MEQPGRGRNKVRREECDELQTGSLELRSRLKAPRRVPASGALAGLLNACELLTTAYGHNAVDEHRAIAMIQARLPQARVEFEEEVADGVMGICSAGTRPAGVAEGLCARPIEADAVESEEDEGAGAARG